MSDFEITYAAHTATGTFLLDSEGICRNIVFPTGAESRRPSKAARAATSCVGAQYVASLDPNVSGMLAEMPRVGAAMLFARIDERGRVSLVRTGVVTRFERHVEEDPFTETPSTSVSTSAPPIAPSGPSPRFARRQTQPDLLDRTDELEALPDPVSSHEREKIRSAAADDDDDDMGQTSEYQSSRPRSATSAAYVSEIPPPPPVPKTLRQPSAAVVKELMEDDPTDPYAAASRALPRPSTPPSPRTRKESSSERVGLTPPPPPARTAANGRRRR